jgi:hypothetical protein
MSTPYKAIQDSFHSRFKSKSEIIPELEIQYLISALGEFELELFTLTYDETTQEIIEDLPRSQLNLLGILIYKYYKKQELDGILQLNNIVGKDIALTSMGDHKKVNQLAMTLLQKEISDMFNKIKDNSFSD